MLVYNKLQIHINTSSPIWTSRDQTPGTFQLCVSVQNAFIEVQALLSQPFGYASFNLDLCWPARVSVLGLIRVVDLSEGKKRVPFKLIKNYCVCVYREQSHVNGSLIVAFSQTEVEVRILLCVPAPSLFHAFFLSFLLYLLPGFPPSILFSSLPSFPFVSFFG